MKHCDKIMIVEDDAGIRHYLQSTLSSAGYDTVAVGDGSSALALAASHCPDCILLDLGLPDMDGVGIIQSIRKWSSVPIIVISARMTEDDKAGALDLGADDYLTKPFDTKELLARVAVRLREPAGQPLGAVYTCGGLTMDTASHSVSAAGRPVALTRTEYAILKLLMQHPGQVIAKSVLLERISADTPDCTESSLKTHISHLRAKLRQAGGRDYVEAVWGIGFRLGC